MAWALPSLLAGGLLVRLVLAALLPPGYDEAYYLFYGRHPALSYFDHPPAVGLWSWLGGRLGNSILALRLPSVLSYTLALALIGAATRHWFGRRAELAAVLLGTLSPLLFFCGGVLVLPDSPLLLALGALLWWLARHPPLVPGTAREAAGLGLVLGALTLCKYQALLVLPCLLAWCLRRGERRAGFLLPWPWLALAVWALVSSPLWIWNLRNGWASFLFQGSRTTVAGDLFRLEGPPLFLLGQVLLIFPTIALVLLTALGPSARRDGKEEARGLLRWLVLPQLVGFTLLAGRMQVLASWLVPAWWMLLPLAGDWLERHRIWLRRPWPRALTAGTILTIPILLTIGTVQVRWGLLDRWLPAGLDTSAELMPADTLRKALQRHPALWQALREADVIASNRYDLPGFLALALGSRTGALYTTFASDARGFAWWQPPEGFEGASGVLFALSDARPPLRLHRWASSLGPLEPLGEVQVPRGGRPAVRLEFFRFGPLPAPWPRLYGPRAAAQGFPPGTGRWTYDPRR